MENPWIIGLDGRVEWIATLPVERPPEQAEWVRTALAQGDRLGVHRVLQVPDIGYDRAVDGDVVGFLDARAGDGVGPLFFANPMAVSALVAFHDADGTVVERELSDLGTALEPFQAPVRHRPPLELKAFDWSSPPDVPEVEVVVRTYSDIWLPWTAASYDPDSPVRGFGDNRVLAARHTPRLNAFLAVLRDATHRIGGRWELDRDSLDPGAVFQVDDHGVRLDADAHAG